MNASTPTSATVSIHPEANLAAVVENVLNLFPEVTWDRWAGNNSTGGGFYGWIPREDGRADFVLIMVDEDGAWLLSTSSAHYSAEFNARLGFSNHSDCRRVEHDFPGVRSVHLPPTHPQLVS